MTEGDTAGTRPRLADRFATAMASRDPQRVAAALNDLRDHRPPREPIAPPAPEVLDAFPDGAPGDVVRDYIWALAHYRPFVPDLPAAEKVRWWAEAILRNPDAAAALQIVLYMRHDDLPPGADVADLVSYLAERGVRPEREEEGAEYLARHLLDHSQTYDRAVRAMITWKGLPVLDGILRRLMPYVRPEDRISLGL